MSSSLSEAAAHLAAGRYSEGWPLLEKRSSLFPHLVPPLPVSYPEWAGESLLGKSIVVWVEQGLGDQIMFSRFGTILKQIGARHVTLCCRPPLAPLLSTVPGVDLALAVGVDQLVALPRHDVWTRYASLPLHLGITLQNLPRRPYLHADPKRLGRWHPRRRIGVVWRTSPTGFNAAHKRLPDDAAARLLASGAISLHPEDTGARDFADTAAIVEQLDAVISVDTAVAHLAGAMGKPLHLLLPAVGLDWRWMQDRADSPWYPSATLYRNAGDWNEVVDRVLGAVF